MPEAKSPAQAMKITAITTTTEIISVLCLLAAPVWGMLLIAGRDSRSAGTRGSAVFGGRSGFSTVTFIFLARLGGRIESTGLMCLAWFEDDDLSFFGGEFFFGNLEFFFGSVLFDTHFITEFVDALELDVETGDFEMHGDGDTRF